MECNRKHILHMIKGDVYNGRTLESDVTHATFHSKDDEFFVEVVKGNFKWTAPTAGKYTLILHSNSNF